MSWSFCPVVVNAVDIDKIVSTYMPAFSLSTLEAALHDGHHPIAN